MSRKRKTSFWVGLALGCGLATAVLELPYLNWHPGVPPLDATPLVVRRDAKGDGRFLAPRSGQRRHQGIDLAAPLNSPVRAVRSGRVVQVGFHRGLGRFIELEHQGGLRSLYAHLNAARVEVGARVKQGEIIGDVGKTGNARHPWISPHLHLEVLKDGEPIDPKTLVLLVVDPAGTPQETHDASGGT